MSRHLFWWRALWAVALTAFASVAAAQQAPAKTVVLVHGAFADGSSWQKVIPAVGAGDRQKKSRHCRDFFKA
ncbi:hypothetical protein [Cupriavidus agavae]|uniref:Alpha/beta hydrolase n=1 Tax=Cupriavidus agavae TaxID=1001822 RepID=A0A4Q7RUF3_9BURK|nr:hypothetical protein [Cupriavidus agavae]RZT36697.1 hypothetical protein EV147_3360 [Cupriavidus agavae]